MSCPLSGKTLHAGTCRGNLPPRGWRHWRHRRCGIRRLWSCSAPPPVSAAWSHFPWPAPISPSRSTSIRSFGWWSGTRTRWPSRRCCARARFGRCARLQSSSAALPVGTAHCRLHAELGSRCVHRRRPGQSAVSMALPAMSGYVPHPPWAIPDEKTAEPVHGGGRHRRDGLTEGAR